MSGRSGPNNEESRRRVARGVRRLAGAIPHLAVIIGAITVVAGAAIYVGKAVERQWFWRSAQYKRIDSLVAGMGLDRFVQLLGAPVFARSSTRDGYIESTFQEREYWVQTVSDRDGAVVEYAVTSCADAFHPTIPLRGIGDNVTLRRSRFAEVDRSNGRPLEYVITGTGESRSRLYDGDVGADGTYNKELEWGYNDACPDGLVELSDYIRRRLINVAVPLNPDRPEAAWIPRFRKIAVVNTFAETSANVTFSELNKLVFGHGYGAEYFGVGADRLLTRYTQPRIIVPR